MEKTNQPAGFPSSEQHHAIILEKNVLAISKMNLLSFCIFVIIISNLNSTAADCCYPWSIASRRICVDGDPVDGFYCGKGRCNIFGCNCHGGCKKILKISKFDTLGLKDKYGYHIGLAINSTHFAIHIDNIVKYEKFEQSDRCEVYKLTQFYREKEKLFKIPNPVPEQEIIENIKKDIGKSNCSSLYLNGEYCVTKWLHGLSEARAIYSYLTDDQPLLYHEE